MLKRADVSAKALEWEGVPYREGGRTKEGADCVGVLIGIGIELGLERPEFAIPSHGTPQQLMQACSKYLGARKSPAEIKPGDVVLLLNPGQLKHVAIVVTLGDGLGLVHSHSDYGRVITHRIDSVWRARIRVAYSISKDLVD
jgi:cell wall-associated NlpC family hydrolase